MTSVAAARLWSERVDRVDTAVVVVVVSSWTALLVHDLGGPHTHGRLGSLPGWMVMVVAMMGPVALPAVRHVAVSSLRWRRLRAVGEFGAGYLAAWLAFGIAAIAVTGGIRPSAVTSGVVLLVAAGWQVTAAKRRFLQRCHRAIPLPPTGRAASVACARFGWIHGVACVGSCWPVMLVMAVVPVPHVGACAALLPALLHERLAPRPRRAARQTAVGLALAGAAALGWGVLS